MTRDQVIGAYIAATRERARLELEMQAAQSAVGFIQGRVQDAITRQRDAITELQRLLNEEAAS